MRTHAHAKLTRLLVKAWPGWSRLANMLKAKCLSSGTENVICLPRTLNKTNPRNMRMEAWLVFFTASLKLPSTVTPKSRAWQRRSGENERIEWGKHWKPTSHVVANMAQ